MYFLLKIMLVVVPVTSTNRHSYHL